MPKFQREIGTAEFFEEVLPLVRKHYKEIAHYADIPLDPSLDQYARFEEMGLLRIFTARDSHGFLIGYSVFFVRPNLHYKSSLQAVQDVLYIDPDRRGFGMKFIEWCDQQLREEKVQAVYHHVKVKHDFGKLLERLGYQLIDLIYARRLD